MDYPVFSETKHSIFDVRRVARVRAFICPGAGYRALGRHGLGLFTFFAFLGFFVAGLKTTLFPGRISFWVTAALGIVACGLWFAELLVTHSDRVESVSQPAPTVRRHWFGGALLWSLLAAWIITTVSLYSWFTVGLEMTPTLRSGKRILLQRVVDPRRLTAGKIVLFRLGIRNQVGTPGRRTIARIVAGPGDRIAIRDGAYEVNGITSRKIAETREYFVPVILPDAPETITVPPHCFYVVQDSYAHGVDSAVLSWVAEEDLVSTELLELSPTKLLEPLDETPKIAPKWAPDSKPSQL